MKNRKLYFKVLMIASTLWMLGCASFSTASSNRWFEYELLPSNIKLTGEVFMTVRLSDGSMCYVSYDEEIYSDGEFYYVILMQDFGWHRDVEGKWSWRGTVDSKPRRPKLGHMHINPQRQVALYFYPSETYGVFKVQIEKAPQSIITTGVN